MVVPRIFPSAQTSGSPLYHAAAFGSCMTDSPRCCLGVLYVALHKFRVVLGSGFYPPRGCRGPPLDHTVHNSSRVMYCPYSAVARGSGSIAHTLCSERVGVSGHRCGVFGVLPAEFSPVTPLPVSGFEGLILLWSLTVLCCVCVGARALSGFGTRRAVFKPPADSTRKFHA